MIANDASDRMSRLGHCRRVPREKVGNDEPKLGRAQHKSSASMETTITKASTELNMTRSLQHIEASPALSFPCVDNLRNIRLCHGTLTPPHSPHKRNNRSTQEDGPASSGAVEHFDVPVTRPAGIPIALCSLNTVSNINQRREHLRSGIGCM